MLMSDPVTRDHARNPMDARQTTRVRLLGTAARQAAVAAILLAAVVAACGAGGATWAPVVPPSGGGATSGPAYTGPAPTPAITGQDAILTYGYGPTPNPAVTFQPDVVVKRGVVQQQGLPMQISADESVQIANVVNGGRYRVSLNVFGLAIEGHFPL